MPEIRGTGIMGEGRTSVGEQRQAINYMLEINRFYDWLETHELSAPAITLWHGLIYTANKARWVVEFAASMAILEARTGLEQRAIKKAREELQSAGLITYEPGNGNKASTYKVHYLQWEGTNNAPNCGDEAQDTDPTSAESDTKSQQNCGEIVPPYKSDADLQQICSESAADLYPHNKLNETKQEDIYILRVREAVACIEKELRQTANGIAMESIETFLREGVDIELIKWAIGEAAKRDKRSWGYVERILQNKLSSGIRTLEDMGESVRDGPMPKGLPRGYPYKPLQVP